MSDLSNRILNLSPDQRGVLAKKLKAARNNTAKDKSRISSTERTENKPLSYAQRRLWFLHQLRPSDITYNIPCATRLTGSLNVEAMEKTLSEIIRRHEILRTRFQEVEGKPQQIVDEAGPIHLRLKNLSHLPEDVRESEAVKLAESEAGQPFNLSEGPLLRLSLIKISESEHILLLTMHHIISDAWSFGIMVRELQALYCAYCDNTVPTLAPMTIQYADYARWQQQPFFQKLSADQLDYWKKKLADLPPLLDLPTDHPRPAVQTFAGSSVDFALPATLTKHIQTLRRQEGATLFMVLMAGFVSLLNRYTGQQDITIGTDIANRNWSETEDLMGFFVNQIALRVSVGNNQSFADLLRHVKDETLDAFAHQDLPFEQLVGALKPERSMSYAPLFQVKLVVQNTPMQALALTDLTIEPLAVHNNTVGFDLILTINESPTTLTGSLEYNTDLFERSTIDNLLEHYLRLLESAVREPSKLVARLPVISPSERCLLQNKFNRSETDLPAPLPCLHVLFEQHATIQPEHFAIISDSRNITYGELNTRANQLSHYLIDMGTGPDVLVGVCLERSVDMVIAILAVLKAGGACLPLDPKYPHDRLAQMLDDAAVPILLTQEHLLAQLPSVWSQIVCLDEVKEELEHKTSVNPDVQVSPENLAYVIYTSGSTGKPKGVAVEHYGIANLVRWQASQFNVTKESKISQFASYSFDAAVGETCMALLNGATLVMLEREDLDALVDTINRHQISVMVLVPSMLKALSPEKLEHPEKLTIVSVGEACPPGLASNWAHYCKFANAYGPTEYTVYSHLWDVYPKEGPDKSISVPIGFPIANTKTYILDANLNPVPIGHTGEIYISGPGIARGYLNKPGITATKFLPNPFLIYEYFEEKEILDAGITKQQLRDFAQTARAYHLANKPTEIHEQTHHLSPSMIFKLIDSLSPDLIKKTHLFIQHNDESSAAYGAFSRYLLEGINQSYSSYGINAELLRELLPLPSFDGVKGVDFGFGNGEILQILNEMGADVVGLDFNPVFVQKALDASLRANMVKVDLDTEAFLNSVQIAPNSQDFVISTLLLDRLANPHNMLKNFFELLKADGCFAIQTLLPVIGQDDGDVPVPFTYTIEKEKIVPGNTVEEDKLSLVRLLIELGGDNIQVRKLDYAVVSRDGVQQYMVWSFTGRKNSQAVKHLGTGRYQLMYKTGDLGRFLPDGEIEFRGRVDNQLKIRGYRIELGEIEAAIITHEKVNDCAVICMDKPESGKQLLAYFVSNNDQSSIAEELANYVQQKLPSFMLPAAFLQLESLPLLSNGKIDYDKLPEPDESPLNRPAFTAPRTDFEQTLAKAWQKVLNREKVGIHDNIFELGGDSILILQILAELNQQGIQLRTSHFFEFQTIAGLSEANVAAGNNTAEQSLVTGKVLLSPIQHWFFEQELQEPHYYNQSITLSTKDKLDHQSLSQSFQYLVELHDALRLRFDNTNGQWHQYNPDSVKHEIFSIQRLTAEDGKLPQDEIRQATLEMQASLDIEAGTLIKARLFCVDDPTPDQLLIVVHHLVVDGVSWRILLEDLHNFYGQLASKKPLQMPSKTSSWKAWTENLKDAASTAKIMQDTEYWLRIAKTKTAQLPVDFAGTQNTEASSEWVTSALSTEDSEQLLERASKVWHTSINEVLLAAFSTAIFADNNELPVLFDVEGHGREDLFGDADVSRTVGWFTSLYPLLLCGDNADSPLATIKKAKLALRGVPHKGMSYGLIRYLSEDPCVRDELRLSQQASISFNYLGQLDGALKHSAYFDGVLDSLVSDRSLQQQRQYMLEITSYFAGGQLRLNIKFSRNIHQRARIESMMERAVQFIATSLADSQNFHTQPLSPGDFPLAEQVLEKQDPDTLKTVLDNDSPIENIYPLTALQQGMLFHSLAAPGSGVYVNQISCDLKGELDLEIFQHAWLSVMRRHEILRNSYLWGDVEEPLAVVYYEPNLPFNAEDWRHIDQAQQGTRLNALLNRDRMQEFKLNEAPLMRLGLVRLDKDLYRFYWSFHHLLLDGWSVHLVLKEVFMIYEAARGQTTPPLDTTFPYVSYIDWLSKQNLSKAETFWRQTLHGVEPSYLPSLGLQPSSEKGIAECEVQLTPALTNKLQAMARQHRFTTYTIIQGAWALLQSHYTNSDDLVFGAVVSGRPASLSGAQQTVGLFINTLPVRVNIDRQRSPVNWLCSLQQNWAKMSEYEFSPLMQVQNWAGVNVQTPLFNVVLVFENYPISSSMAASSASFEVQAVNSIEQSNYPITLLVIPGEPFTIRAVFNKELFEPQSINRLLTHFKGLIEAIVDNPEVPIGSLNMLSTEERSKLLVDWNNTKLPAVPEQTLLELFNQQVRLNPDRIAIKSAEQQRSYRALEDNSNRLARYLSQLGVKRGALVGVGVARSVQMVETLLAVMKVGAAYVPLDPTYPQARLRLMIEDSQMELLVADEDMAWAEEVGNVTRVVQLSEEQAAIDQLEAMPLSQHVSALDPAYVIYTSGSTGKPKGVVGQHGAILNRLNWMWSSFPFEKGEVCCQKTSLSFIDAVWEIFGPLLQGVSLTILSQQTVNDPRLLVASLAESGVTRIVLVPSLLRTLLETIPDLGTKLPKLNFWVSSGETLTPDVMKRFKDMVPGALLLNLYGSSEVSADVTYFDTSQQSTTSFKKDIIGRPIANTQLYILDTMAQPVPVGVPGELYVGGANLAQGYLNAPLLTALKFVPNPFSGLPGDRLFRTGDICRYTTEGDIEYLGRIDHQIKIRGIRVELGDIEAALCEHPVIEESVVVAKNDGSKDSQLLAYYVCKSGQEKLSSRAVLEFLKSRLQVQLIPSVLMELDTLPRTPNGKIDKLSLPLPEDLSVDNRNNIPPSSDLEEKISKIWQEVLGVKTVSVEDNFFELGGQSLSIVRIQSLLKERLALDIAVAELFKYPTIRSLASSCTGVDSSSTTYQKSLERGKRRQTYRGRNRQSSNVQKEADNESA